MKMNNMFKIIGIIIIIVPIIMVFIFTKPIYTILVNGPVYYDINYIFLLGMEIINIAVTVFIFTRKEKLKKLHIIIICLYIILSTLIPVYYIEDGKAPIGPNANLMGLSMVNVYKNIYGIDISGIINTGFKI